MSAWRTSWLSGVLGVFGLSVGVMFSGCRKSPPHRHEESDHAGPTTTIRLASSAFREGQAIPKRHTGEAEDLSPPLVWSNLPEGARQIALIVDDPDAPSGEPWVHWVIYNIPAKTAQLPEGVAREKTTAAPRGAAQGANSWGEVGYRGPMPPPGSGIHHYRFTLYALNAELNLRPGLTKKDLLEAMSGRVLAEGRLVGTYQR